MRAAVTKVLIPLMAALTAATPGVNVIVGVTAAVAGVVGVVTALATAANEGVPSVKELTEAARDMQKAMDEAGETYEENARQTMATAEVADLYIGKLEEIEAATGGNVEGNQEYQNILGLLLRTIPELSDCISETTDQYGRSAYTLETTTEALRRNTEAWKKNAETQAYQEYINSLYDQYGEVLAEAAENEIKLTQAQVKLDTAEQKRNAAMERLNELTEQAGENNSQFTQEYYDLQNAVYEYNDEIRRAEKTIGHLNTAMETGAEAAAAAEAEIRSAEDAVSLLTGATGKQTEAEAEAARQSQELQAVIGDTAEEMARLAEAYGEAYDAALDSISGQYTLWDEAAAVAETSAGSINNALESQITYWQEYNKNLQSLTERSGDIEGLGAVIASFADGSEDSVNAIAGMASASDTDLQAMVENWQELQKEQEAAAESMADLKTGFSSKMDELQAEFAEDVRAMDLGEEAKVSGRATIQGYIDGANSMLPVVRDTYAELARAASGALGPAIYSDSAYAANKTIPQYAGGTDNAAPGFALVGEEGPELVYFRGGEKVMDAAGTNDLRAKAEPAVSAMLSGGGGGPAPVQIVFQISGNATPETVQALRDYGDEFADRVREVLEDMSADAKRRAY